MNRREAAKQATEVAWSFGDLRRLIAGARGRGGMSCVNPGFTHEHALDILAAGIKDRGDDEIAKRLTEDYAHPGRMKRARDSFIVQNILRECVLGEAER